MTLASKSTFVNDRFRLEIPAKQENVELVCKFISGIAGKMGFADQDIQKIALIVDEACANVVNHAYEKASALKGIMYLSIEKYREKIEIAVADKGAGFDPGEMAAPDMETYQKNSLNGGLGLHLIKEFSDEVQFEINPGVCNKVKMVKFLQN